MSPLALAALMLLAIAEAPDESCVNGARPQVDAFKECAAYKARQLEPSGESPDDIAIAATGACVKFKNLSKDALAQCLPMGMVNELGDHLDKAGRDIAVEIVVEICTARRSPPR